MNRRKFFKAAGLSALAVTAGMNPLPSEGAKLSYATPQTNRLMNDNKKMKHKCKITVLKRECYQDLQAKYLADPKSGPCPFFREGQEIIVAQRKINGDTHKSSRACIGRTSRPQCLLTLP